MTQKQAWKSSHSAVENLINTAQNLLGISGLDGVSLRQISLAAGYGNNYAVQYHFGDLAGLIRAILIRRMPEVELRRAELLSIVKAQGRLSDARALTDILYLPLIRHGQESGERSYARFILALQNSRVAHRFATEHFELMPIANHVVDLLSAANPDIPRALIGERQRIISIMVLTSIFNRRPPYDGPCHDELLIENALEMATVAVTAPLGGAVQSHIFKKMENLPQ